MKLYILKSSIASACLRRGNEIIVVNLVSMEHMMRRRNVVTKPRKSEIVIWRRYRIRFILLFSLSFFPLVSLDQRSNEWAVTHFSTNKI